jgi:uncharacterized protein
MSEASSTLMDRINNDIKEAMKAKEKERLEALRFLKAKFIENNTSAKPQAELDVAIAHEKKLRDSIASYPAGHAHIANIEREMSFLKPYLPMPLTEVEVKALIQQLKNSGAKNFAEVMKELAPQIKGRFDGKLATDFVKASFT